MMSKKQIIYDVLTSAYRSSSILYDNLGIPMDRDRALLEYCATYNGSPKILGVIDGALITGDTPKEFRKYPDTLTREEKVCALMLYALRWITKNWDTS